MKTPMYLNYIIIAAVCLAAGLFAGCSTKTSSRIEKNTIKSITVIQEVLGALLPEDFPGGPIHLKDHTGFWTITVDGGNIHKINGKFSFDWIEYHGSSSFPLFSGLSWQHEGDFILGNKPTIEQMAQTIAIQAQQLAGASLRKP